jgi:hypothetical protein
MSEPNAPENPGTPQRRTWLAWALLGAVALTLLGFIAARVTERGRFALPYSTSGAGPEGTRALYQLLGEEGFAVETWNEDIGRMPPGGALVLLGGCDHLGARPFSRPERERLTRWIERGGTFVVAGASGYVTPELGASLRMRSFSECLEDPGLIAMARANEEEEANGEEAEAPPDALPPPVAPPGSTSVGNDKPPVDDLLADPDATFDALDGGLALAEPIWGVPAAEPLIGLPLLGMRNAGAIELAPGADARILASTGGKIGVVEIRRGEGRVIVLASASLLQNRDLTEHGGALLMTRLLRHYLPSGAAVRFDEYHVGAGERRSMARYFTQVGVVPLLLQVLFGFALLFFARSRRFGGVRPPLTPPLSSTQAFVGGLAGLFRASRDKKGTQKILAENALRRIADAHRQPEHDVAALTRALEDRGRKAAATGVREVVAIGERSILAAGDLAKASRELDDAVARATRREA